MMVASTLVGISASNEHGESLEHFVLPPGLFFIEFVLEFPQKCIIPSIFPLSPVTCFNGRATLFTLPDFSLWLDCLMLPLIVKIGEMGRKVPRLLHHEAHNLIL